MAQHKTPAVRLPYTVSHNAGTCFIGYKAKYHCPIEVAPCSFWLGFFQYTPLFLMAPSYTISICSYLHWSPILMKE